jgi:hypothetical protein
MAFTKIYLTRAFRHDPIQDITAKAPVDLESAQAIQKALASKRDGASISALSRTETSSSDGYRVRMYRGITGPLDAQTISGTVNFVIQVAESDASANLHWWTHIWVTEGDTDVVRATLLNEYEEAAGVNEWPTTRTAIALNAAQSLTSSAIQAGDRIFIEIGYEARNTIATSLTGQIWTGTWTGGAPAGDLTLGSASNLAGFVEFSNSIATQAAPANDNVASAINITSLPFIDTKNTEWATEEGTDPEPSYMGQEAFATTWYKFTPASTGSYVFNLTNDFFGVVAIFTGSPGSFTEVVSDEDPITVTLTSGVQYHIMVGAFDGGGGNYTLNVNVPIVLGSTTLSVTNTRAKEVSLAWTAVTSAEWYRVERCTGGGCSSFSLVANPTLLTLNASGVPSTTYRFRVRAEATGATPGPWSNIVDATTLSGVPPLTDAPFLGAEWVYHAASSSGADFLLSLWQPKVKLTWTHNGVNITGFAVYRATGAGSEVWTLVDGSIGPSIRTYTPLFIHTAANTVYRWKVVALSIDGDAESRRANITTGTLLEHDFEIAPINVPSTTLAPQSEIWLQHVDYSLPGSITLGGGEIILGIGVGITSGVIDSFPGGEVGYGLEMHVIPSGTTPSHGATGFPNVYPTTLDPYVVEEGGDELNTIGTGGGVYPNSLYTKASLLGMKWGFTLYVDTYNVSPGGFDTNISEFQFDSMKAYVGYAEPPTYTPFNNETGEPEEIPDDEPEPADTATCDCTPGDVDQTEPPATDPPEFNPIIGAQMGCVGGGLVPTVADPVYAEMWWGL